jgi:hypothetical protein
MLCICLLYGGYASVLMCLRKVVKIHLFIQQMSHVLFAFWEKADFCIILKSPNLIHSNFPVYFN